MVVFVVSSQKDLLFVKRLLWLTVRDTVSAMLRAGLRQRHELTRAQLDVL